MTTKPESTSATEPLQTISAETEAIESGKKAFVEPQLSDPVDVLEATTFFQVATSGVTLP